MVKLLLQQPNVVTDARDEVRVHYGNISMHGELDPLVH